jgi:hypothetical protein|tara:strand:+ start:29 stop:361 length:333 start_codon:yes stop_codon:yes gene_type:complete
MAFGYKILGQSAPADTSNADLYSVPTSTETIVSSLAITNVTAAPASYRIYIRNSGAAAVNGNALVKDAIAEANTTTTIGIGISLAATDIITVQSGTADSITFHAFGTEVG